MGLHQHLLVLPQHVVQCKHKHTHVFGGKQNNVSIDCNQMYRDRRWGEGLCSSLQKRTRDQFNVNAIR